MRVLVISAAFPPLRVGEAEHALHLCQHLADRGLDVHVLTTIRSGKTDSFPFKVYPFMQNWTWQGLPRFATFLRRCSPDAILLIYSDRDYNRNAMITFAPTISKFLLPHVPFVTQIETEYVSRQNSYVARAFLKIARSCVGPSKIDYLHGTLLSKSDRIIVLSELHQSRLLERFPSLNRKCMVIPPPPIMYMSPNNNGLSRQRRRDALGMKPDEFFIVYFGYIYSLKGVEDLFKALQLLNQERSNVRLIMLGGNIADSDNQSYINRLLEHARQLGIADKITWKGDYSSDSDEPSQYLYAADACVFPFTQGVTLNRSSVATAAAHGLPIVTTKGETLETPFIHQENLLLCPPQDPKSLALAIDSLIRNPQLRQRLSKGALQLSRDCFSWEKAVDQTIKALMP